jgi:hypothetical protein
MFLFNIVGIKANVRVNGRPRLRAVLLVPVCRTAPLKVAALHFLPVEQTLPSPINSYVGVISGTGYRKCNGLGSGIDQRLSKLSFAKFQLLCYASVNMLALMSRELISVFVLQFCSCRPARLLSR